jgi:hypothetical protein
VLFHDDVVTHRKAKPGSFTRRLGGKERIEHLFPHLGRDSGSVVANADFYRIAEVSGGCADHGLKT